MTNFSSRLDGLFQSDIRALTQLVNAVDGINLGQGICDLPTPDPIKRGAIQAIQGDKSIYSSYSGVRRLREPIYEKVRSFNRIPADSSDEIMVSAGATGAFVTAAMTLLDAGDDVVLFEPFYGYHLNILKILGIGTRNLRIGSPEDPVDFDALDRLIAPTTRAIVVTTPNNPSGKVWTRAELTQLLEIAERHDLYIITDEIYEYMTYDGHEHISPASIDGAYDRTVTISGFSKTYNMTGWRLGYAVAKPEIIDRMGLLNDLLYICAPTPLQYGVSHAFSMGDAYFDNLRRDYAARREKLATTLERIGMKLQRPQGAYYILADYSPLRERLEGYEDDRAAAETLIREAGVAAIPGRSFFTNPADGRDLLRFTFAKEMPILEEACRRLESLV